ncbi:hypothetical protein V8F20_008216 [Naviculisporaceae sp. PSN 640]
MDVSQVIGAMNAMNFNQPVSIGIKPQRCPVCSKTNNLRRCGACKVVTYCSTEHQVADRPKHKSICNKIKRSREKLESEEASLRAKPGDFTLPDDVFTNGVGRFWGILDTRDYMRARFQAADALIKAGTCFSLEAALDHLMDMLRLCRSDNMGVRDIIPALMMRLGQEQRCYDFLKWWATCDPNGTYDWGDMSLPYLNIRNADVFEPIDDFRSGGLSLPQLAILTLLKLSLGLDLEYLVRSEQEAEEGLGDDPFPRQVGSISKTWMQRPQNRRNVGEVMLRLKAQYAELVNLVHKANSHFWKTMVDDELPALPQSYALASQEEAALAVNYCKAAYEEIEDVPVMIDCDTAQYFARPPIATTAASGSIATTTPTLPGNRVVAICLDDEKMFNEIHSHLISAITSKRNIERATTVDGAIQALGNQSTPPIILIADAAITRRTRVFEEVAACLRKGATVVLCGCFSTSVNQGQFNRSFAQLGLPWKMGSYHRATTTLRRETVGPELASRLPSSYNQKAMFVKGAERPAMWYTEAPSSTEAAAAFVGVGNGKLGYIGDVNGEKETTSVVLAMCGLLD